MIIDVKLTQSELVELTYSIMYPDVKGRRHKVILNQHYLVESDAYKLMSRLDRELLKLAVKKRKRLMSKKQ